MRYDKEKGLISVSVREAVTTARRGMSGYLTHDEDEPELSGTKRHTGFTEDEKKELKLPFTVSGIGFELFGTIAKADGDTVCHTVSAPSKKEAKKSEFTKQIRGEIFLLAAMYIERGTGGIYKELIYGYRTRNKALRHSAYGYRQDGLGSLPCRSRSW